MEHDLSVASKNGLSFSFATMEELPEINQSLSLSLSHHMKERISSPRNIWQTSYHREVEPATV